MSVIVKGMKMPDRCASCPLLEYDDYATGKEHHCNALNVAMSWDDLPEGRREDCPLVELIRCKDCKNSKPIDSEWLECQHDKRCMKENGFCSWAERRGEE